MRDNMVLFFVFKIFFYVNETEESVKNLNICVGKSDTRLHI